MQDALEEIKVVRLELHEELLKIPQYRALVSLDDLIRRLEQVLPSPLVKEPEPITVPEHQQQPVATVEPANVVPPQPTPVKPVKKSSKPMTQVQALQHILKSKDSPASIGWILAELELLGVAVGGASPRKTIGVALSGNKELFRRVEFEGHRWLWGLTGKKYPGETTFSHLPPTTFKSMRVVPSRVKKAVKA